MRKVIITPIQGFGEPHAAKFHQWGVDYEEFETGPGNASVAIIETSEGAVKTVQPHWLTSSPP